MVSGGVFEQQRASPQELRRPLPRGGLDDWGGQPVAITNHITIPNAVVREEADKRDLARAVSDELGAHLLHAVRRLVQSDLLDHSEGFLKVRAMKKNQGKASSREPGHSRLYKVQTYESGVTTRGAHKAVAHLGFSDAPLTSAPQITRTREGDS